MELPLLDAPIFSRRDGESGPYDLCFPYTTTTSEGPKQFFARRFRKTSHSFQSAKDTDTRLRGIATIPQQVLDPSLSIQLKSCVFHQLTSFQREEPHRKYKSRIVFSQQKKVN